MTTPDNAVPEPLDTREIVPVSTPRPLYWSIRRELWENRSIYLAPLAAAAVFMCGFLISLIGLPSKMRALSALNLAQGHANTPYEYAAVLVMGTAFIVGIFYSLEAFYGERRERSILFWKSLPVSDLTTVLSKLAVPLVILPLLSFAISAVTQLLMLLLSSAVLLGNGLSVATLWGHASFFHFSLMLFYHIVTIHGLWYAPLYGWLLLVSAWAPRAPFIWAFLPPFVIVGVEKLTFNTAYFFEMLRGRLMGPEAPTSAGGNPMDVMVAHTPLQFLSEPGLWTGLALAALFLAAAARLRRYRGPI